MLSKPLGTRNADCSAISFRPKFWCSAATRLMQNICSYAVYLRNIRVLNNIKIIMYVCLGSFEFRVCHNNIVRSSVAVRGLGVPLVNTNATSVVQVPVGIISRGIMFTRMLICVFGV